MAVPHTAMVSVTGAGTSARHPFITPILVVWIALLSMLGGCDSQASRLDDMYALAAGPTGRGAAGQAMRQAWFDERVTLQELLDLAHLKIESPADHQSAVFAMAVLDVIEQIEPEIDRAKVNDFLWTRIGTLAGNAAAVALGGSPSDVPLAASLVLAGTDRWQTDSYWLAHPDHDALVASIMHAQGKSQEALTRLRSRPDFDEHRHKVIKLIEDDIRRKRGG